ncbi:MAG: hypothetical protein BMS9Abin12_0248 [Acidimicrobiia bacterium]|nr:MAG: hypothetical protein BMS9Abin12_0248 [Acidimicrobiia bacterium]
MVPIEVPLVGDERRKNWAKVITNVDETLTSGWAFEGDFVATGGIQDVPIGSVLMVYGERGSRSNPQIEARLFKVNNDGTVSHISSAKGRAWARTLRDEVVLLLTDKDEAPATGQPWDTGLLQYSIEALAEELRRRGR